MSSAPKQPSLQNVASPLPQDLRNWVNAVSSILNALTAQNPNAQGVDSAPTLRDLLNTSGITVQLVPGQTARDKPTLAVTVPAGSVEDLAEVINDYIVASGAHAAVTVTNTSTVNLSVVGQEIQASVVVSYFDARYEQIGAVSAHESAIDPHPQYLTPAEGSAAYDAIGAASSAVSSHEGAADPHTQYLQKTAIRFPFYDAGSLLDTIPLNADGSLPFFDSTGLPDNINLVT